MTSIRRSTAGTLEPAVSPGPVSVLLAEHEPEVAEMSARYLRRSGREVRLVTTPERALAELTGGPGAVAVLDLTMPGLDPRRIRRALRTPVIFLMAGPKGPRPRGLALRGGTAGPRQWLARPFGPRQLVAMVGEVLAGPPGGAVPEPAEQTTARLRLDGRTLTAMADGRPVKLTATEFAMLTAMIDQPGRVVSRRRLLLAAGREQASDRAADVYIAQLRAKLGPAGAIRTARGAGYAMDL